MINRDNIHHGAILKPQISKCIDVRNTGRHAFTKLRDGGKQCIGCGMIKPAKVIKNGIHKPTTR